MSILSTMKSAIISVVRPNTPPSKRRLFLSAGHSNKSGKDMGARYNPYPGGQITIWEGQCTAELRSLIYKLLVDAGFSDQVVIDADSNITAETLQLWSSKVKKTDLALDIHFNAAAPTAHGVEVIVPDKYSETEWTFAQHIAWDTNALLKTPLRGKEGVITESQSNRGRLGWMRMNCETILWEVCFLSNPEEFKTYETQKVNLAAQVAHTLMQWLKEEI